jgi:flagellar assembly factor FliW
MDPEMPMTALVFLMPMPSYDHLHEHVLLKLQRTFCKFHLKSYSEMDKAVLLKSRGHEFKSYELF